MVPICLRCVPAHQGQGHNLQDIVSQISQLRGSLLEGIYDASSWLPPTLWRLPRRPVAMSVSAASSGASVTSADAAAQDIPSDTSFVESLVVGSFADFRGLKTGDHWMTVRVREKSSEGGELTLETPLLESRVTRRLS